MPFLMAREHRVFWRSALLVLVVLPFLPEIVIHGTTLLAKVVGCSADEPTACPIGVGSASGVIRAALNAGIDVGTRFAVGVAAVWLALCYLAIIKGWTRLSSQLWLGFGLSVIFGVLLYFAPQWSLEPLRGPHCNPDEGGIGKCDVYGGDISQTAGAAIALPRYILEFGYGGPIAIGAFVLFVFVVLVVHYAERRTAHPKSLP